ncbi:MAG: hypothetical protein IJA32_04895 [Lachnospiraceae bacterium]|nr:hypothetical protein [Lachnospiraceae bacterium]
MESYFDYVGELDEEFQQEIKDTYANAIKNFKIQNETDGRAIAKQVNEIVEQILESGKIPDAYEDKDDAIVALGVLFGQALCIGYGWKWMGLGKDADHVTVSVVSPKGYFCNAPLNYLYKIISGNNIGLDGENDNTVLLLYNMLAKMDEKPGDKMYIPLA